MRTRIRVILLVLGMIVDGRDEERKGGMMMSLTRLVYYSILGVNAND